MTVRIDTDGKRIQVRFPYNHALVAAIKSVHGRKWEPEDQADKHWSVPLTVDSCRVLRRKFGREMIVSTRLADWYRAAVEDNRQQEAYRSGDAESARDALKLVYVNAPQLYMAIDSRAYQVTGAAFLDGAGQAILGDKPGLGKTLQTLAAIVARDSREILVSCPRTATRTVWERETARWTPHITTFVAQGTHAQREQAMLEYEASKASHKMLIINTEMMRVKRSEVAGQTVTREEWPFLFAHKYDAIIIDEAHNTIASTKNIQSKNITQGRLGAVLLRKRLRPDGLAIPLSGTPERSDLPKLWGMLNWVRPDVFSSFWGFAEAHFGVEEGQYSKQVGGGGKNPAPLDKQAWDEAIRPYFLQRDKNVTGLPPIVYAGTPSTDNPEGPNMVWLDMEPKQEAAYKQMERMASVKLDNGTLLANGVLAEITRLRQFASSYGNLRDGEFVPMIPSNKLTWIDEFLVEREGWDGKVVIASAFTKLIKMYAQALGGKFGPILTLTGETSDKDRTRLQERFQDPDDDCRICIINLFAGGEAITLDVADDMILNDMPWKVHQEEQVTSRIHRVSRQHNVTVYRLASVGTVDDWMASLTEDQRDIVGSSRPEARELAKGAFNA